MHVRLPKPLHGWREFAGEVGIIVLGVLIALTFGQLVEWVHSRQKQNEMMERLFEEARIDVAQLRDLEPDAADMQLEVDFATQLTKDNSCPPVERWMALETLGVYPQVRVRTSVYDEVIGAGGLSDIASTQARDAVAAFHARLAWVQGQTDFFRSQPTVPVPIDDRRLTLIYDPQASEPEVTRFDRQALCDDHGFRNRMVDAVRDHVVWDGYRRTLAQSAIRMCGAIGRALGRQCTPSAGTPFTDAERRLAEDTDAQAGQR